jgi:hypothetical protein
MYQPGLSAIYGNYMGEALSTNFKLERDHTNGLNTVRLFVDAHMQRSNRCR